MTSSPVLSACLSVRYAINFQGIHLVFVSDGGTKEIKFDNWVQRQKERIRYSQVKNRTQSVQSTELPT